MTDPFLYLPSSGLGLLLVGCYGYRCWRLNRKFGIGEAVNIILSASGIVAGILLMLSTFMADVKNRLNGIEIYMLIAGLAVLFVSIQAIRNYFVDDNNGGNGDA